MDAINGKKRLARPYGVGIPGGGSVDPVRALYEVKTQTEMYGRGDIHWNQHMHPDISPAEPLANSGTYGKTGGYRYQMDAKRGKIKPVARGASAYTGRTDFLSILLGR